MTKINVHSAFNQELIETIPRMTESEAYEALDRAYKLYQDKKSWPSRVERIEILEKVASIVKDRSKTLALKAAEEGGKPLRDSIVEINRAYEGIKLAITELHHLHGTEIPMNLNPSSLGRMAYTKLVPRGVVLAISAFNHPFNLIVHQVIPAIAVGCPVLVKPASSTPISCRNLVNILHEAGLPKDWCQMLTCGNDVTEKFVSDERVSFLTFIGSGRVGWHLRSKLAPGATCALEHGGVAPVIVDHTADIDQAVPLLCKGGFYHAGQVCVSVQRIIAHKNIVNELTEKLSNAAKELKVGDPTLEITDVGPLISPKEVNRVSTWVDNAIQGGAKLVTGGQKISDTCYEPTILLNPPQNAEVSTQEVFGPVVCIYTYESFDEAIKIANSVDFAFQAAVFSKNLDFTLDAIDQLEGQAVMVNDHTAFRVDWMPFGGHKQSGLGLGGIGHTMKDMTIEKMFVIKR